MALKDDPVREDEEEALREFLTDSECLEPLSKWTRRFNVFDVLKITNTEIRHSNVLAWLMDPAENHGLHDGRDPRLRRLRGQACGRRWDPR